MRPTVFLLLIFSSLLMRAQAPDEVQYSSLKGHVKSVRENSYAARIRHTKMRIEVVKGKPQHEYSWDKNYLVVFDSSGNKISKTRYRSNGKMISTISYRYDNHGFLTKEYQRTANGNQYDSTSYVNIYNVSGQIAKRYVRYPHAATDAEFWYAQDAMGNTYETFITSQGNPVRSRDSRTFDKNWHVKVWWMYTNDGKPSLKHNFTYDDAGRLIADSVYVNSWTTLGIIYKWKYDEQGVLTRYDVCNPGGLNCEGWTYQYTFDTTGNWISATEFRNGKAVFVKERIITYY